MTTDGKGIKLGELLIRAGLLKSNLLKNVVQMAAERSLPIGRVLIMSKAISEPLLQAAVQAQAMIRDDLVDEDTAIEALQLSAMEEFTFDEALSRLTAKRPAPRAVADMSITGAPRASTSTARLGELLVSAHLITAEDLEDALSAHARFQNQQRTSH
jgi:hypothetical protein